MRVKGDSIGDLADQIKHLTDEGYSVDQAIELLKLWELRLLTKYGDAICTMLEL